MKKRPQGIETGFSNSAEHEPQPPYQVKEEWFDSYVEGNASVPQISNGIDIFVTAAVLEDAQQKGYKINWIEVEESRLDIPQVHKLGKIMSDLHSAYAVRVASHEYVKPDTGTALPPSRFAELWTSTAARVIIKITELMQEYLDTKGLDPDVPYIPTGEILNTMYKDSKSAEALKEIADTLITLRDIFRSPEIKTLLKTYKENFRGGKFPGSNVIDEEWEKIAKMVESKLKERGINTDGYVESQIITLFLEDAHA